jgi:CheY-like chemotaxis protein
VTAADGHVALDLLVESVKASLHKSGPHAHAGTAEKNGAARFDMVLLDFVMPRMNGFQFCRALRQNEELRAMPVVLMSAKSDKIREQFVLQTGAIDAITKPFDATALVAVIENAIKRAEAWRQRGEALEAGIPDDFENESLAPPPVTDTSARRVRTTQEIATRVATAVAPALAHIIDGARLTQELGTRFTPDAARELVESVRTVDIGGGKIALWGDLSIIPIGAVLQLLQIENQTGVLAVRGEKSEVVISMRKGLIDLVQARGAGQEFRLGRYFVEHGLVTPDQIDSLLRDKSGVLPTATPPSGEHAAGPPTIRDPRHDSSPPVSSASFGRREESTSTARARLLGDLLVESGRVTRDQLKDGLARQSSELTYEVLRWQKGRFEFRRESPPALAESARLALPVASVVMEGFRRVDEWRLVEAGLGSFDAVLQRDAMAIDALGDDRLARSEKLILDTIDGERTVREVIAASHMSSFDACKILFQLLEARLVRRRAA